MSYQDFEEKLSETKSWMFPGEGEFLFNFVSTLPNDAIIVEIGSYFGYSTSAMGFACLGTGRKIFAVDRFVGEGIAHPNVGEDFLSNFKETMKRNGLSGIVSPVQGRSVEVFDQVPDKIDFLFIDADHRYDGVKRDYRTYAPKIPISGLIGFHDANNPAWPDVEVFWQELLAEKILEPFKSFEHISIGTKLREM